MKNILVLITTIVSLNSLAATYKVNTEHSKIKFSIKYMGLTNVEGRFNDFKVYYELDGTKLTDFKGSIKVDSIDTADKKRDSHLRKSDFFYTQKYPRIKFESVGIHNLEEKKEVEIKSKLTIKDITKDITFKLTYLGQRVDPWTKKKGNYYKGSFKINRTDFGIKWNKKLDTGGFIIDEDVFINFEIEAYPSSEKPAFSRFYKPDTSLKKKEQVDLTPLSNEQKETLPPLEKIKELKKQALEQENQSKEVKSQNSKYSSLENIGITLATGFVLFLVTIFVGITGQSYISSFLEKLGIPDDKVFILASLIVMIILIVISIYTAPYMGLGVNPLVK